VWIEKTLPYARGEIVGTEAVNPNMAYKLAEAFARLGDRDNTLAWLDTGIGRRAFLMPYANVDPLFSAYRGDAGFRRALARMGFPVP
jgi:hypothetical protein